MRKTFVIPYLKEETSCSIRLDCSNKSSFPWSRCTVLYSAVTKTGIESGTAIIFEFPALGCPLHLRRVIPWCESHSPHSNVFFFQLHWAFFLRTVHVARQGRAIFLLNVPTDRQRCWCWWAMRCHKMRRVLVRGAPGRQPKLRDVSVKRRNDFETMILKIGKKTTKEGKVQTAEHKIHPVTYSTLVVVWQTFWNLHLGDLTAKHLV